MAGEPIQRTAPTGKEGLQRRQRRIAVRIDMTPMVDIAFLLLIFYMVSTVFSMPQAMEINLPPNDPVVMQESDVLTIRVDEHGRYWWNHKRAVGDNMPVLLPGKTSELDSEYVLDTDALRKLLRDFNRSNANLATVIMIHPDAVYSNMIDILDEIETLERIWNQELAARLGKDPSELTEDDGRFSYRYAHDEWEEKDSRIIDEASRLGRSNDEKPQNGDA